MPTVVERNNSIISFLPPVSKSFIKKCAEVMDEEAVASWIITFGIQQMQEAHERLEQKFLPDELASIRAAVAELNPSLSTPPLAAVVAEHTHGTRLLRTQVASLSKSELFVLTFFTLFDRLIDKKYADSEYLSALAFARQHKPPCSKAWISMLCKQGRVPGAFKDPATGRWKIPVASLDKVYVAEKVRRVDGEIVKKPRRRKKGRAVSCLKKTHL